MNEEKTLTFDEFVSLYRSETNNGVNFTGLFDKGFGPEFFRTEEHYKAFKKESPNLEKLARGTFQHVAWEGGDKQLNREDFMPKLEKYDKIFYNAYLALRDATPGGTPHIRLLFSGKLYS